MYSESQDLQTQINSLSEELRNVRMQLQALYKHLNLNVNAKREVVAYTIQEYKNGSGLANFPIGQNTGQVLSNIKQ